MWGFLLGAVVFWPMVSRSQEGYSTPNAFGTLPFTNALVITSPPGETNRIFIAEQAGVIVVITNLAAPTRTVFMNISGPVAAGGERGLLGLAFHPGYSTNRQFFAFFTTDAGTDRLSRFETSPSNPNQGMAGSEVILINQPDQANNHNGGDLHFGPDGYLYVALGDEGGSNDQYNNSQIITQDFFAGILRIDVDKRAGNLPPSNHSASSTNYWVPADNPFVGATSFNGATIFPASVRTEFWAVGLRNPWRFSFDPANGWIYCGDVGQGAREEINIIRKGGNYGWAFREGSLAGPKTPPTGFTSEPPIYDYARGTGEFQGTSVTGGLVYRGTRIPQLEGHYIFADHVSGNVWHFHYDGTNRTAVTRILDDPNISTFGRDPSNGDILYGDLGDSQVKRIVYTPASALFRTLVAKGATWRFLDNGSNQSNAWTRLNFDDTNWKSGPAELGYGDNDEATTVNGGPTTDRFVTTYFRHKFNVDNPSLLASLAVNLLRDDGAMVYLNEELVFRSNMPEGNVSYLTRPLSTVGDGDETTFFNNPVTAPLRQGENVLAVEVHQINATSSDMSFDLELVGSVYPEVAIQRSGNTVILSWPAPAPGYFLEASATLGTTASWNPVSEAVTVAAGRSNVTVNTSGEARFFRLSQ